MLFSLFVVILLFTLLLFWSGERFVYYEGSARK